jgi:two-component system LytT family response regulator
MIKAIIIEDEQRNRLLLQEMIVEHFRNIKVLATCATAAEGLVAISTLHPDLVFSDIELGDESVFDMLQELTSIDFEIIFTTAYEKYAIQAIKFSALDYLLKPFSVVQLTDAINQYEKKQFKKQSGHQFEALFHNLKHLQKNSKKIALPTLNGLLVIPIKEIIRCQSDVNYTTFYLIEKNKIVVSKSLKEFEELLSEYDFIRVHNSHLINLHYVKNYTKGDGGIVTMADGTEVDVSRRKKEEFLKRLADL